MIDIFFVVPYQQMIFIGETHPLPIAAEHVDVRPAAQCARCKRLGQVTSIERNCLPRRIAINQRTTAMIGRVLPVGCRVLRTVNEDKAIIDRAARYHTAVRPMAGCIQHLHFTRVYVHPFDTCTVEDVLLLSHVVRQPLAIVRPAARIGQYMSVLQTSNLAFGPTTP